MRIRIYDNNQITGFHAIRKAAAIKRRRNKDEQHSRGILATMQIRAGDRDES
jgi:hypothetical protein